MPVSALNALGLYISIPFCRSKCTYCNFASGVYPASAHSRYVDRLIEDLTAASAWAAETGVELPRTIDTVYLGGGTPSLLAAAELARLLGTLREVSNSLPMPRSPLNARQGRLPMRPSPLWFALEQTASA